MTVWAADKESGRWIIIIANLNLVTYQERGNNLGPGSDSVATENARSETEKHRDCPTGIASWDWSGKIISDQGMQLMTYFFVSVLKVSLSNTSQEKKKQCFNQPLLPFPRTAAALARSLASSPCFRGEEQWRCTFSRTMDAHVSVCLLSNSPGSGGRM